MPSFFQDLEKRENIILTNEMLGDRTGSTDDQYFDLRS